MPQVWGKEEKYKMSLLLLNNDIIIYGQINYTIKERGRREYPY